MTRHFTFYSFFYRTLMKVLHYFHLHYAPPIHPEGDTMLWCKWCGFRQVTQRKSDYADIRTQRDEAWSELDDIKQKITALAEIRKALTTLSDAHATKNTDSK